MWPACRDDVLLRFRIFSENDVVQKRILPNHRVRRISQIIYTVYLCSSVGIRVITLRVSCCSSTSDDVVRVEVRDKLEILSNIREHHDTTYENTEVLHCDEWPYPHLWMTFLHFDTPRIQIWNQILLPVVVVEFLELFGNQNCCVP